MKKILLTLAAVIAVAASVSAQKLSLTNNSCTDVNIVLYANTAGCGPLADESVTILIPASTSITYNFTGTIGINSSVGGDFTWNSTGIPGNPSGNLPLPPASFNFFRADVWSVCGVPTGATCANSNPPNLPYDGVTINNPSCGSSNATFVNSTNCGSCGFCGSGVPFPCGAPVFWCVTIYQGNSVTSTFTMSGSDWIITVN